MKTQNISFSLQLTESSFGRIALHLVMMLRTGHIAWHFQGIARELRRA